MELTIRETYGADALEFEALKSPAFHAKKELVTREDAAAVQQNSDLVYRGLVLPGTAAKFTRLCAFHGERTVAGMELHPMLTAFDGAPCPTFGIGGVLTDPELRRTGAMRALFPKVMESMHDQRVPLSHLYGFSHVFYRKFGYEVSAQHAEWEIPMSFLPEASSDGIRRYTATAEDKAAVRKVMRECRLRSNLSVLLAEGNPPKCGEEAFFESIAPYVSDRFTYLHFTADGTPDGVLSYSILPNADRPQTFDARRGFWFTSPAAAKALLRFLGCYQSYGSSVLLALPADVDLSPLLGNLNDGWGMLNVRRSVQRDGTSRIVDAAEMLRRCRCRGAGRVAVRVEDDMCPWNRHTFVLDYCPDGNSLKTDDGARPDLTAEIGSFTALLLGRFGMENADWLTGVSIDGSREALANVFYPKSLWIEEHF